MTYFQQPLGDVPTRRQGRVSGGAVRVAPTPAMPMRSGAVIGGVPKMSAIRKTMESQGFQAEGHITKGSNFDPSMLQASREQLVRGYAQTLQNESGGRLTDEQALRRSSRAYQLHDRGIDTIPGRVRTVTTFAPPLTPVEPGGGATGFRLFDRLAQVPQLPTTVGLQPVQTDQPAPMSGYGGGRPIIYDLGDGMVYELGDLEGLSIKGVFKAVKKIASPIQKGAAAVGHTVGTVVTSKVGQAVIGTALAATGVGIPAAAAIMAGTKAAGNLIKPGGNIKHALTGALQGAAEGVAAGAAGAAFKAVAPGAQSATSNFVKGIESKFVQAGKGAVHLTEEAVTGSAKLVGKGAMGVLHAGESIVGGVASGVVGLGKKILGIGGSFNPTDRDPNGTGINQDNGLPTDEASTSMKRGQAVDGRKIDKRQRPTLGQPGNFPPTKNDPNGTGIDQTTGQPTREAQTGLDNGTANSPGEVYAPSGGGGYGGGGYPVPPGGSPDQGLPPDSGIPPVLPPDATPGGMDLSSLFSGGMPTIALAGVAAFVLFNGAKTRRGGGARRSRSRSRSRRRR